MDRETRFDRKCLLYTFINVKLVATQNMNGKHKPII